VEIKRISKDDLWGISYVKKPDGIKWDSYYKTLNVLRPLFKGKEFIKIINGFYLNVCERNLDSVRISYFVHKSNSKKAVSIFKQFFINNGLEEIKDSEPPKEIVLANNYGGEELEECFRNFLALETQIGLELINGNLLNARILFATYRWQVRKASLPFKKHFEATFKKYSPTYNSFSSEEKDKFFTDLEKWPNPLQVDWAHMMVNFVLGCDWNYVFSDPNYITPEKPFSIFEINEILNRDNLDFEIPLDWKP